MPTHSSQRRQDHVEPTTISSNSSQPARTTGKWASSQEQSRSGMPFLGTSSQQILILSSGGVRNRETEKKGGKKVCFYVFNFLLKRTTIKFFSFLFKMPIMISMLIVGINSKKKKIKLRMRSTSRSLEPLVLFIDQCYDLEQAVIPDFFAARNSLVYL